MNDKHGTHTLYAVNVSGDGTDVIERAYFSKRLVATLMVATGLVGFGWLHKLATDEKLTIAHYSSSLFWWICKSWHIW